MTEFDETTNPSQPSIYIRPRPELDKQAVRRVRREID